MRKPPIEDTFSDQEKTIKRAAEISGYIRAVVAMGVALFVLGGSLYTLAAKVETTTSADARESRMKQANAGNTARIGALESTNIELKTRVESNQLEVLRSLKSQEELLKVLIGQTRRR